MQQRVLSWWPHGRGFDEVWSILRFWRRHRRWPRVFSPKLYNDLFLKNKLGYCARREVAELVDKELVKAWARARGAECPETFAVMRKIEELGDFCATISKRARTKAGEVVAVVKPTHASGKVLLIKREQAEDGVRLGRLLAGHEIESWLKLNFYEANREPQYRYLEPKVIAEEFLEQDRAQEPAHAPDDIKVFCHDGAVAFVDMYGGRFSRLTRAIMTVDWDWLAWPCECPFPEKAPERPACLDEILQVAAKLSRGLPPVRIDFYATKQGPRLGELTFTPADCQCRFSERKQEYALAKALLEKRALRRTDAAE